MPFKSLAGLAALLAASAPVFAAAPVDVSPLVNDRTIAVAQVDLEQIKLRPAFDWAIDTAKRAGAPKDVLGPMEQGAAAVALIGQPSVDGLRRAGVTTLGVVVQLNVDPTAMPILLLTVPKPADPKKAVAALGSLGMRSGEKNDLMVFSPNLPPGVLAGMQPTERPDLAVTMNASAFTAALGLSPKAKADLLANKVAAADPKAVAMVNDLRRTELRVDTAGGPHIQIITETASPEAAAALKQQFTMDRPDHDGKTWAAIAKTLPLIIDGSSLVTSMRQPEIDAFAKTVATTAQSGAVLSKSSANLRTLVITAIMYANTHDNAPPASMDELVKELGKTMKTPTASITTNPARPELGDAGYVYVPLPGPYNKTKGLHARVALYEAGDFGEGINVAFWDGHVEQITDEAKFKAMLPDAAPATAPAAMP